MRHRFRGRFRRRDGFWALAAVWVALVSRLVFMSSAQPTHSSNYAVVLSSSRYWFNYRHTANALTMYQFLKRKGGLDDDHIILMLADEYAANPRNPFKNRIFTQGKNGGEELYDEFTEIDYRGDDVTVENLAHVLLGTTSKETGMSQEPLPVLNSDADSNILLFWTGHGGDKFFKFQDVEEILAQHLANVFRQMHAMGRYRHVLFLADTCQAFTLFDRIQAEQTPNITTLGSSLREESSYAHHSDPDLGLTVIERYSFALRQFLQSKTPAQLHHTTLQQGLVEPYAYAQQRAHVGIGDAGAARKANEVPLSDFFVNVEKEEKKQKIHRDVPRLVFPSKYTAPTRYLSTFSTRADTLFDDSKPANRSRPQSATTKQKEQRCNPAWSNLCDTPLVEPADPMFWIFLAAIILGLFCTSYLVDRQSTIMAKMHRYNALFDGRCKSMHIGGRGAGDCPIRATIEDLWDKSSLVIVTPNGEKLKYDAFEKMLESYLQRGMSTELLLLEKHPKGLRYRVCVLLDGNVMTLESIATVVNDKIVQVEPAANSDMSKFLERSSNT